MNCLPVLALGPQAPDGKPALPGPVHLVDFLQLSVKKLVAFNGRLSGLDSISQWPQKGLQHLVRKYPRSHGIFCATPYLLLWPYVRQTENPSTPAWDTPLGKIHQQHLEFSFPSVKTAGPYQSQQYRSEEHTSELQSLG